MKKVTLYWRLFQVSILLFAVLSFVAVSRPLGDSALDELSMCLPFICIYYVVFGIRYLEIYEENQMKSEERNSKIRYKSRTEMINKTLRLS